MRPIGIKFGMLPLPDLEGILQFTEINAEEGINAEDFQQATSDEDAIALLHQEWLAFRAKTDTQQKKDKGILNLASKLRFQNFQLFLDMCGLEQFVSASYSQNFELADLLEESNIS